MMLYIQFCQKPSLPKSPLLMSSFCLYLARFDGNFQFFEKFILGSDGFRQNWKQKTILYANMVLKINVLFVLDIVRVISLSSTLC